MHVLGIDVGGSKTVCLLADGNGQPVASTRGEGANPQGAGLVALEKVLHAVMDETLAGRNITPAAICLGIAGVDRPEDAIAVRAIMERIGYQAKLLVVNDALIALQAGIGTEAGIVIVSGTGSIAYGRNEKGEAARAGGWGYVLGDEGSAYWIGRRALRAVVRHVDGRGRTTVLTDKLLRHFQAERASQLIRKIYHEEVGTRAIAATAKYVQQSHDEGDRVATTILSNAVDELAAAAGAVMAQLELDGEPFTFVLAGGAFQGVPWLCDQLIGRFASMAPGRRTIQLKVEPAVGAVALALAELRGGANLPVYKQTT